MLDCFSNKVALTYTGAYPNHQLSQIQHGNGQYLSFTSSGGLITRIDTPTNTFYITFAYNAQNELTNATRVTSSGSAITKYLYDTTTHSITQKINSIGNTYNHTYEYVSVGGSTVSRGTSMALSPSYYQHSLNYTNQGTNKTQVVYNRNGLSQAFVYEYDYNNGRILAKLGPNGLNLGTRYLYDTNGNQTAETMFDANIGESLKRLSSYDNRHHVVSQTVGYNTNSTTNIWTYSWFTNNDLMASIHDPSGAITEFAYDRGMPSSIKVYGSSGSVFETKMAYNSNGLLTSITNANGHYVNYFYNAYGFCTSSVPQIGPTVGYEYNRLGHLYKVNIPGESGTRTTTFESDELGWTTNIIYADGTTNRFWFDSIGNMTNYLSAEGRTTRYTYAPTRKLSSVVREVGNGVWATNTFTYDNQFNTLNITDERGRGVESYVMDIQDRPVTVTNLEGQTMSIQYALGNFVKQITRFDGTIVSNTCDADGRMSSVQYPDSTNNFTYCPNGLLKTVQNEFGSISNAYDLANRLIVQKSVSSVTSEVSYSYFPAGQVSNVISVAGTNIYALDNADRVSSLQSPASTFYFLYNSYNGLISAVSNSSVNASYGFDVMDQATNITWRKSSAGTILKSFAYGFSSVGMITNVMYESGEKAVYVYDGLDRVTNVSLCSSGGSVTNSMNYFYDLAGNRMSVMGTGVTNNYVYSGNGNKLVTWGTNTTNLYDNAGNITNIKYSATFNLGLTYNGQYQVTQIKTNGAVCETFQYDPMGRRTKIVSGSETNYCVYDGANVVADLNATGALVRSYVWAGIDNMLSITVYTGATTKVYYPLKDHLGSIVAMVDASTGNIVENYRYSAWGQTTVMNGSSNVLTQSAIGNRYCWTGREYSYKTTLYFHRSRFYCSTTGRWISPDKIGIAGGKNLYVYCSNQPISSRDPLGWCDDDYLYLSEYGTADYLGRKDIAKTFLGTKDGLDLINKLRAKAKSTGWEYGAWLGTDSGGMVIGPLETIKDQTKIALSRRNFEVLFGGASDATPTGLIHVHPIEVPPSQKDAGPTWMNQIVKKANPGATDFYVVTPKHEFQIVPNKGYYWLTPGGR